MSDLTAHLCIAFFGVFKLVRASENAVDSDLVLRCIFIGEGKVTDCKNAMSKRTEE